MELRVLRYFLAVCEAESISAAADNLHITQPTISRQLMDLEKELGVKLLNRGHRSQRVTLTEAGTFLRKRAEELVTLADKTAAAFQTGEQQVTGDVYISAGETEALRWLMRAAKQLQAAQPLIGYHVTSGDGANVEAELENGVADFGVLLGPVNNDKYDSLTLPMRDSWGILMRSDAPLARQSEVYPEQLWEKPLILNRQGCRSALIHQLLGKPSEELHIVATYNLAFNASLMTAEGLGYTLLLRGIIHASEETGLVCLPLAGSGEVEVRLVWKKHQVFSTAARLFLEAVQAAL